MSGIIGTSPNMTTGVIGAGLFLKSIAIIGDNKAHDTHGKNMTGGIPGTWQIRDLNTKFFDEDSIVSIASNQFTLQPASLIKKAGFPE